MRRLALLTILGLAACGDDGPRGETPYTETIPHTDVRFEMVWVPGANAWMGRTEVTWAEYEAYFLAKDADETADAVSRPSPPYLPHDRGWGRGRMPAVGISRHAAESYCAWLSHKTGRTYRLPTEAEWTAACTAVADADAAAWHAGNSGERPHEVGTREPNALGLCDLLGNAWEYCSGAFAPGDPRPVLRGGCWDTPASQCACDARRACPEAWNDSDAQRPRGIWWLADGPYVGLRVLRPR